MVLAADQAANLTRPGGAGNRRRRQRKDYGLLLAALPFLAFVIVFRYIPLGGWLLAFCDYRLGHGLAEIPFVGFGNFADLLSDYRYLSSILLNTVCMNSLLLLNAPIAVGLSVLITELPRKKLRSITQTATTLPHFVSMVIVYSLFFSMFSSSGAVNRLLLNLGIVGRPINVLGNPRLTWFFQFGVYLWKHCGWNAIIFLSAITSIDPQLYDAAAIDGAGRFRRILHVTLPGILSTFLVVLLLNISRLLSNGGLWEQAFVFMNPMVQSKLEILDYYIYRMGIVAADFSYATAAGVVNSAISIALLFSVNGMAKRLRGQAII